MVMNLGDVFMEISIDVVFNFFPWIVWIHHEGTGTIAFPFGA